MIDAAKLARVAAMQRESLPRLEAKARDITINRNGVLSRGLIFPFRILAMAAFHVDSKPEIFRERLREAGLVSTELVEQCLQGQPIDESLVSIRVYRSVLDLLAAQSFAEAVNLVRLMQGTCASASAVDFDIAMGHGVRHAVLDDTNGTLVRVKDLEEICEEREFKPFLGYASLLKGIVSRDHKRCEQGLRDVLAGHRKLISKGGFFADTPDMFICVWGLGLANLARYRGIDVTIDDELLPRKLLNS